MKYVWNTKKQFPLKMIANCHPRISQQRFLIFIRGVKKDHGVIITELFFRVHPYTKTNNLAPGSDYCRTIHLVEYENIVHILALCFVIHFDIMFLSFLLYLLPQPYIRLGYIFFMREYINFRVKCWN